MYRASHTYSPQSTLSSKVFLFKSKEVEEGKGATGCGSRSRDGWRGSKVADGEGCVGKEYGSGKQNVGKSKVHLSVRENWECVWMYVVQGGD